MSSKQSNRRGIHNTPLNTLRKLSPTNDNSILLNLPPRPEQINTRNEILYVPRLLPKKGNRRGIHYAPINALRQFSPTILHTSNNTSDNNHTHELQSQNQHFPHTILHNSKSVNTQTHPITLPPT